MYGNYIINNITNRQSKLWKTIIDSLIKCFIDTIVKCIYICLSNSIILYSREDYDISIEQNMLQPKQKAERHRLFHLSITIQGQHCPPHMRPVNTEQWFTLRMIHLNALSFLFIIKSHVVTSKLKHLDICKVIFFFFMTILSLSPWDHLHFYSQQTPSKFMTLS